MDQQERDKILKSATVLKEREERLVPWFDPYSDMSSEEKSKLIMELMRLRQSDQERIDSLIDKVDKLSDSLLSSTEESRLLRLELSKLSSLQKENASLKEQLKLERKNRYGSRSQKGVSKNASDLRNRVRDKDDFDGTPGSLASGCRESDTTAVSSSSSDVKECRLYRQGLEYRRMSAGKSVSHLSDKRLLPAGSTVIKIFSKYSYEQVSEIVEHSWEVIRYKTLDGSIYEGYFPCDGHPEIIDMVPGTHASCNFLAYLAFNKYTLDTPLYRELGRIMAEDMRVSRMTLTNWLDKGAVHVKELIKVLKNHCLEKDSIINCDETWCRVKVDAHYKKRYVWCLVNKLSKIVIYCYEDGSRSRDALRHILGDSSVKALQSDGYNVYMYLDDRLIDTDHLCCMAHARAKFKYALEQGGDNDASYFLECMGELYGLESEYEVGRLSSEQITACRQGLKTKEIIIRLRSKLDAMLSAEHPARGDLMDKALRYLDTFWNQLFVYLKDGCYSIDNSIAERFIRPLAGERKNSLFFGSDRMAETSAAYHTVISTCRMHGISALEYLRKFFREIVSGRRDYENLLPMTIGIKTNKL